jgi:hypothetical protein
LKPIEFKKEKAAIAVPSLDKLPSVIDTLIAAVRNGELDQQFADASVQTKASKSKGTVWRDQTGERHLRAAPLEHSSD